MVDRYEFRMTTGHALVGGIETETFDVLATDVKGYLKVGGGLAARDAEVGGRTSVSVTRTLVIPWDSPAIPAKAYAVCLSVDASSDPTLLGARLILDGPAPGSQTTARRLQVSEVLT